MRTFPVSDVAVSPDPLPALDRGAAIRSMLHAPVEQMWTSDRRMVACTPVNGLVQAAQLAFDDHYPLVLTPDAVWFCLAQGFAHHVAQHAEALRGRLVRHQGKAVLLVRRDDFELGRTNPWPEAFAEFSEQIAAHVGKLRDLVVADFTTTGPIERAASEVVLMATFAPYFKYLGLRLCGIPSITLTGTPDDWRSIRRRVAMLSEFGLDDWIRALTPVLDQIVDSSEGRIDTDFWRSFVRHDSMSGDAELTGWINVLFPYIAASDAKDDGRLAPNPHLSGWEAALRRAERRAARRRDLCGKPAGPAPDEIRPGVASARVKFVDLVAGAEQELKFVAGLFGVVQDERTLALAPEFGWAVLHDTPRGPE